MREKGVVLLEALVAVAVLSVIGVSAIGFVAASLEGSTRLAEREEELLAASNVLTAMALLSRAELDERIGLREVADFVVWVDRPERDLYRLGVAPADHPAAEVISTLVFRPVERPR